MQAGILSIGDELVLGQTVDTNSAYLSAQLAAHGIGTAFHATVADDQPAITRAILEASRLVRVLIVSGGLGPTDDDLTRQALADAMGVPLAVHEPSVQAIAAYFQARGRDMPDRNRVQAMHPQGTHVIPNSCGTAPGIKAVLNNAVIFVTPGVPREMFEMFRLSILPELTSLQESRGVILTTKINTFGAGESSIADKLGDLMNRTRNPKVGTTVSDGIVAVRVRSEFTTRAEAQQQMDATITLIEQRVGPIVYGREDQTIQDAVVALLRQYNATLVTAESCTGGLIGKMVTDVSGSSDVYRGGWVTYSNEMKMRQLGVEASIIDSDGAVSESVARAMAHGALERSDASVAVSVTGIAGPTGGTTHKPVGTVWIGLASRDPHQTQQITSHAICCQFGGDRDTIRDRAAKSALQILRFHLLGESTDCIEWRKANATAVTSR